jgi:hypothetical protein
MIEPAAVIVMDVNAVGQKRDNIETGMKEDR